MVGFGTRRPSLTASYWRQKVSDALSLGSRMRPIHATHVLALFFPVLGMVPAIVLAMRTYFSDEMTYRGADEASLPALFPSDLRVKA